MLSMLPPCTGPAVHDGGGEEGCVCVCVCVWGGGGGGGTGFL